MSQLHPILLELVVVLVCADTGAAEADLVTILISQQAVKGIWVD